MKHNPGISSAAALSVALLLLLTSCMFTGVENTGRIRLSKEDKAAIAAAAEEDRLMAPLATPSPLSWRPGKPFLAASDRVRLIFTSADDDPYGRTLFFVGTETASTPSGRPAMNILFRDSLDHRYIYQKELRDSTSLLSSSIPMLVDLDMVAEADSLLKGRTLWPRTRFWDFPDDPTVTVAATQLMPVTLQRISAGIPDFPLRAVFTSADGVSGSLLFSPDAASSRSFSSMFFLSDPRKTYSKITDEKWADICHGRLSEGMTKQEARLTAGPPDNVESGHDYSKLIEHWFYADGVFLRFEDGLLVQFRK